LRICFVSASVPSRFTVAKFSNLDSKAPDKQSQGTQPARREIETRNLHLFPPHFASLPGSVLVAVADGRRIMNENGAKPKNPAKKEALSEPGQVSNQVFAMH
jgi:hypothetical protein